MMSQREAYKELAVLVGFLVIMFWGACEGLSGGLVGSLGGLLRVLWGSFGGLQGCFHLYTNDGPHCMYYINTNS